jgi:hypothetical protein
MSEEISKVCPYCAESVKTAAKICPRCRQWLSLFSIRNPAVFVLIAYFCMVVVAFGFFIFLQRFFDPGMDFSPNRDSLSVVESRMNLQADDKQPMINVVVLLTNKSEVAWKEVQMDLRFYDKAGTLIDANSYWSRGVIYPHGELAFRIKTPSSHPLSDYDFYKMYVRSARDARCRLPY